MKPGTILLAIGALIILFFLFLTYYGGTVTLLSLLLGVAGLITAGVGASRRWERTSR